MFNGSGCSAPGVVSDIDAVIGIEEEVAAAERELNERDRIDLEVWEAENKEIVSALMKKVMTDALGS